MTFGLIEAEKTSFPVNRMCRVLGVSQSGFFAWQDRPACRRQRQDIFYLAHIRTAFALSNGTYGSPRMHRDLIDEGHEIGRHRTARLMREKQLVSRGSGTITAVTSEGRIAATLKLGGLPNHVAVDGKGTVYAVTKATEAAPDQGNRIFRITARN